jgi:hypothetical protein
MRLIESTSLATLGGLPSLLAIACNAAISALILAALV